jgi:hypothetical protein
MLSGKHVEAARVEGRLINGLRDDIAERQAVLESLEAGKLQIGERRPGEPWQDRTQARIADLKRTIATLKSIVDRHDNA